MLERPNDPTTHPQPTTPAAQTPVQEPVTETPDLWRQAFGRASQHLDSTQSRRLRSSLQQRLFDR